MSSRPFLRGLVVGKFCPLHRGHELVLQRALEMCREVVIISYSNPEFPGYGPGRRERWLAERFPTTTRLIVTDEWLAARTQADSLWRKIPHNDAEEIVHRRFCGFLCRELLQITVDAVFTSEDYGDDFATELNRYFHGDAAPRQVTHVLVDRRREVVPVSGSLLRANVHEHRQWLAPVVYASFVRRVCILGGESSGKSTLAIALAQKFGTRYAAEFGRELWEAKQGRLLLEDMLAIATQQITREETLAGDSHRFLFCDTSPLTTLFYCDHLFAKAVPELLALAERPYDLTVLCAPDFDFVQDGTRQPKAFRDHQHQWYLHELEQRRVPFVLAKGSLACRIAQVCASIQ